MKRILFFLLVLYCTKSFSQCTPSVYINYTSSSDKYCSYSSNITLQAFPTNGGSSPTFQWQINGVDVGTSSTYPYLSHGGFTVGDVVSVTLTSNADCASPVTATASYTISKYRYGYVTTMSASSSGSVAPGTSVTFTGKIDAPGTPLVYTYSFYVNGAEKFSSQTNQLTFSYTTNTLADGDVVYCTTKASPVSNPCGSMDTSNSIVMSVIIPCTPSVYINYTESSSKYCSSSSNISLQANPTNGGPSPTFQWQINGVDVGTSSTYPYLSHGGFAVGDVVSVTLVSNAACASPLTGTASYTISKYRYGYITTMTALPSGPISTGTSVTFTGKISVPGALIYIYSFYVNGVPKFTYFSNQTTFSYTTNTLADGDVVYCTTIASPVPNPCGSIDTSKSIVMAVSNVLPVTLSAFNASPIGNTIALGWATASESNSAYFSVQESEDGASFTDIGKLKAAGNSDHSLLYSYIYHPTDGSKTYYFRLKMVDKDGTGGYSGIKQVNYISKSFKMTVSPNPAKTMVCVNGSNIVQVQILDMAGKLVLSKNNTASTNISINVSALAPGMYFLRGTTTNGEAQVEKIIRQ